MFSVFGINSSGSDMFHARVRQRSAERHPSAPPVA